MFLRIFIVGLLIVGAMFAVKDGRVFRNAGLTGSCTAVSLPTGQSGYWKACKEGKLSGRPDLSRDGCSSRGVGGRLEYWRCPAPLGSSRGS
ncbi:MAG TPA: hypothetical protein VGJ25_06675 [Gaiellaceae bacterium]